MTIAVQEKSTHTRRKQTGQGLYQNQEFEVSEVIFTKQEDAFKNILSIHYDIDYQSVLPYNFGLLKDTFVRRIPGSYSDATLLPFLDNKFSASPSTINQILLTLAFYDMLKESNNALPAEQYKIVFEVINELAKCESVIFLKPVFEYSVDDEVCIIKGAKNGNHYIIVGNEENDLSYGFVGKQKGEYDSLHADFNSIGVKEIVSAFINK